MYNSQSSGSATSYRSSCVYAGPTAQTGEWTGRAQGEGGCCEAPQCTRGDRASGGWGQGGTCIFCGIVSTSEAGTKGGEWRCVGRIAGGAPTATGDPGGSQLAPVVGAVGTSASY